MARSGWNPHFPAVAGLEHTGVGTRSFPVQQMTDARAVRFKAQSAGAINAVKVYLGPNTKVPFLDPMYNGLGLPYIVDVMTRANYEAALAVGNGSAGAAVLSNVSQLRNEDGTAAAATRWQDPNDGLWLERIKTSGEHHTDVQFDDISLTGQQVLNIGFNYRVTSPSSLYRMGDGNSAGTSSVFAKPMKQGTGTIDLGEVWAEFGAAPGVWSEVTPAMLEQFNVLFGNRRMRMSYTGTSPVHFDWLELYVEFCPERRIGTGVLDPAYASVVDGWVSVPIHVPAATGAPSLVANTEYVVLIRPAYKQSAYGATGILDLRAIGDRNETTHFTDLDWDWYASVNFGNGAAPPNVLLSPPLDGVLPLRMASGINATNDSQPYEYTTGAQVYAGLDARQRAIPVSTGVKYGLVKAIISAERAPAANLSVTVRNGSTQALIAGPIAVSVTDVLAATKLATDDFGDEYHEVFFDLGADFTLPATVDVQFTSTTDSQHPWLVAALATSLTTGTDVTFGGASSFASGSAVNPYDGVLSSFSVIGEGDLEVVVMTRPPVVTGNAIVVTSQALVGGTCKVCPQDTSCSVTGIPTATFTWTTSPVTGFAYYEVQRDDANGDGFQTIAKLSFEPFPLWVDYAAPYGINVSWRVRVVQTSGATSLWSNVVTKTIPPPVGADIIITVPSDNSFNCAYPTAHASQLPAGDDFKILDADDTTLMPLYGKDGQIALRPTERKGIQFTRSLLLSAFCTAQPCLNVISNLRDLMDGEASAIVVRDRFGCSWDMSISLPTATRQSDPDLGAIWTADVTFTQTPTPEVGIT